MSIKLYRSRNVKQEKSKFSFSYDLNCEGKEQNVNDFFQIHRREQNPVERKKPGSKSKHAKKFSSKKPKGSMGNRKPKSGGTGRKRR